MATTKHIGDRGEDVAADYLEAQGYTILERNYRFERAEVDLVCFQPQGDASGEMVFVEVKTRTGLGFGRPEDAVDEAKQRQIIKAAKAYLYESRMENARSRFDVIGVVLQGEDDPEIEHFENAFWVL